MINPLLKQALEWLVLIIFVVAILLWLLIEVSNWAFERQKRRKEKERLAAPNVVTAFGSWKMPINLSVAGQPPVGADVFSPSGLFAEYHFVLEDRDEAMETFFGTWFDMLDVAHDLAEAAGSRIAVYQRVGDGWEQVERVLPSSLGWGSTAEEKALFDLLETPSPNLPVVPQTCRVCGAPLEFIVVEEKPVLLACPNGCEGEDDGGKRVSGSKEFIE